MAGVRVRVPAAIAGRGRDHPALTGRVASLRGAASVAGAVPRPAGRMRATDAVSAAPAARPAEGAVRGAPATAQRAGRARVAPVAEATEVPVLAVPAALVLAASVVRERADPALAGPAPAGPARGDLADPTGVPGEIAGPSAGTGTGATVGTADSVVVVRPGAARIEEGATGIVRESAATTASGAHRLVATAATPTIGRAEFVRDGRMPEARVGAATGAHPGPDRTAAGRVAAAAKAAVREDSGGPVPATEGTLGVPEPGDQVQVTAVVATAVATAEGAAAGTPGRAAASGRVLRATAVRTVATEDRRVGVDRATGPIPVTGAPTEVREVARAAGVASAGLRAGTGREPGRDLMAVVEDPRAATVEEPESSAGRPAGPAEGSPRGAGGTATATTVATAPAAARSRIGNGVA
jgi:hypothetical protein